MNVTTTWTNNNPNTIYNKLAARLGREPSHVGVQRVSRGSADHAAK